ncbi:hypothetical protein [Paenibacillus sp. LHD-38]|uniref:hypothetical protein n=1 Tax=Paenibacillus sp. LHD-38 TaxID=3072143 RepID=UPI00280F5AEB|nr:hypothetical protein [Paenibacillus sp. LHD-38]MDQ8736882.1 hypothetical protein [Paenibacillus sp. LHD-38]
MKKIAISFLVLFMAGIGIYYAVPKNVVTVTSGEIALKDKKALVDEANVIVRGTVSEIKPSFWSNPNGEKGQDVRNIIQTDIVVNVEEVYKNELFNEKSVTVRIDKGKVGNYISKSEGYPEFDLKEEVILFLSKDDGDLANPAENYYVLTGMSQGKFIKDKEVSGDKIFVNKVDSEKRDKLSLHEAKGEISGIMDDLKKNPRPKMTKEEIRQQNEKVFGK